MEPFSSSSRRPGHSLLQAGSEPRQFSTRPTMSPLVPPGCSLGFQALGFSSCSNFHVHRCCAVHGDYKAKQSLAIKDTQTKKQSRMGQYFISFIFIQVTLRGVHRGQYMKSFQIYSVVQFITSVNPVVHIGWHKGKIEHLQLKGTVRHLCMN